MTDRCPRVVVAVSPRLLGDLVCRAVTAAGFEAVDVDGALARCAPFELGVVSAEREAQVDADVVITLPREGAHEGRVHQPGRDRPVRLGGLADLGQLVRSLVRSPG